MKTKITLRTKITLTTAGLIAMAGIFYAASPTQFGSATGPIGVAASKSDLIVTEYSTQNLDTINCSGKVSLLATIPGPLGQSLERYVTIAPAQAANAGFTPRDIFVTQGADVFKVSNGSATAFATIPGCGDDHTGITFDHVGTFGYNMIVTCRNGGVWSVGASGSTSHIADVNAGEIEGPAIPPLSFGPLGGQILVGDEDFGQVHAISNTGNVTYGVFSWDGAEGVVVIPSNPCSFCSSGSSFFQAILNFDAIYQYPATDFTGLGGSILVTSESSAGTAVITFNGTDSIYNQTLFNNIAGATVEGSAWADCDVPTPTPTPNPTTTPPPPAGTNLAVSAASGTYGGTTTFTAILTSASDNTPVPGKNITFALNGNPAGNGLTDANGVATSSAVLLYGSSYTPAVYPTGAAASFGGDVSFGASSGTNSLTVNKAKLIVSADNKTRPYGAPNPPLTASYGGFVQTDTLATSGVTGTPYLTTTATQYSTVGTYPITITQGTLNGGNNYEITLVPGTLTVYLCGGIIGLNKITIGASSAIVDSYNSLNGPYPNSPSNQASLFSNGTITLQGAKLYGDAVSTGGNVVLQANSLVTGDVVYATTLSNSATVQGSIDHQTSTPLVLPVPGACGSYTQAPTTWITGAYTYDATKGNLTVSGGGTATLANGTYCFNTVTVSGGSTLVINGPVKISVTGKFTDSGGSLQNTSHIPGNLQVTSSYTGSNGVTVSGTSATYLMIYAPGTDLTVSGGGPLYGSLVAKTLTVSGNSQVHQDLGLPCWQ